MAAPVINISENMELEPALVRNWPEHLPPPEELGFKESEWVGLRIPLSCINTLAQQRPGRNTRQPEMDSSIATTGQMNSCNVAIVATELLSEYMAFTNRVFSERRTMDEMVPVAPGLYVLLFAGHSRRHSQERLAESLGVDRSAHYLEVRYHHEINSVDDILKKQIAENIHSSPPTDREARMLAEGFLWEKAKNPGLTRAAYAREHDISSQGLRDALRYVDLPPDIRSLTDDGALPFGVAVELGRLLPWLRQESIDLASTKHPTSALWSIIEAARMVNSALLGHISDYNADPRHRISVARKFIWAHTEQIRNRYRQVEPEDLDLALFDASNLLTYDEKLATYIDKVRTNLSDFRSKRTYEARELHRQLVKLTGLGEFELTDDDVAAEEEAAQSASSLLALVSAGD